MKLRFEDPGPVLTEAEVCAFEKEIETSLPKDYREFLLKTNGGFPGLRCAYHFDGHELRIRQFLSLTPSQIDDLRGDYSSIRHDISDDLLPFANDITGDFLCLSLASGEVYRTDAYSSGEGNQGLHRLADSFTEFCSQLIELPERGDLFTRIAEQGNASDVADLVERKWSLLEKSINGHSLLEEAAKNGNVEVVVACLERGCDLGESLHLAIRNRAGEVARILVAHGASLDALDHDGKKPERYVFTSQEMAALIVELRVKNS